jgi:hypothetical protein
VEKVIFSYMGEKVTGKPFWKTGKTSMESKRKGLQLVPRLKIWGRR